MIDCQIIRHRENRAEARGVRPPHIVERLVGVRELSASAAVGARRLSSMTAQRILGSRPSPPHTFACVGLGHLIGRPAGERISAVSIRKQLMRELLLIVKKEDSRRSSREGKGRAVSSPLAWKNSRPSARRLFAAPLPWCPLPPATSGDGGVARFVSPVLTLRGDSH